MLVLDTDHVSALQRNVDIGRRLTNRLLGSAEEKAITIVSVEEAMRGWLSEIRREREVEHQITPYLKLQRQIESFASWIILPWDSDAANLFNRFRRDGIRIGTLDLKIACIALAHDTTLLTRNVRDFSQVPGLRFENWLDET